MSSAPEAADTLITGRSGTAVTATPKPAVAVPPSEEAASTVRAMSPDQSAGGVRVRESRAFKSSPLRVHLPSPLSMPALRVAPVGTPEMVTLERLSEPGTSAETANGIAVSSAPEAADTLSTGTSGTATTLTDTVAVVVPPSPSDTA